MKTKAVTAYIATFSTSPAMSRMKNPLKAVTGPVAGSRSVSTAAATRISSARKWVSARRASEMNRSTISNAKAAAQTKISGISRCRSAWVTRLSNIFRSLQLGRAELVHQLRDRCVHQVGQRLGIHAEREHAKREHHQHEGFAGVDVGEVGHVVVADLAEHHALDHPQG